MKVDLLWSSIVCDKDKSEKCIWDISFSPDGERFVVGTDKTVIVYNTNNGTKIKVLKNHKGYVYCVSYSCDGTMFASGSADGTVILWNNDTFEGILKFLMNDALQCLCFNPISNILISGALSEFGIWAPEQHSITKTRVSSRVTSCSWTTDGQHMALGMYNGTISIRNRNGDEKVKIERSGGATMPVWTLEWTKSDQGELLAVGDWGQKLTFYQLTGKKVLFTEGVCDTYLMLKQRTCRGNIGKEVNLNFDPCRVSWLYNTNYLLVCGSDKKVYLYTKDGIKLNDVFEAKSWLWCCKGKPTDEHQVISCGQDGSINSHKITFLTVHSLYRDRYAFRDGMTDVIIHHLVTDQKARIKCKDIVSKIAVYKNRLAIQFPDKVNIYQPESDDPTDMQYRNVDKINKAVECNLMIITTKHLIFCDERKLSSHGHLGIKGPEWVMESMIRYTKIIGGSEGKEGILIGQKNGQITKIYLDNHFPIPILKCPNGIRSLDISLSRKKLGVIDECNALTVYDLMNGSVIYQETGVLSLAWNVKNEDMICYAGEENMFIKASDYPSHKIKETGLVVGFNGNKVYILQDWTMKTIEIPQSGAMYSYIQREEYDKAYRVACLGVTNNDWLVLGESALNKMNNFKIAKQAFIKIKDPYYLLLINDLEDCLRLKESSKDILIGVTYAHLGNFTEAAKSFRLGNAEYKALEMYSDIRQFDKAKNLASKNDPEETKAILAKQADWAKTTKEHQSAVNMYLEAGLFTKALEIMKENQWGDMIIDLARKLDSNQKDIIQRCGTYLTQLKCFLYASECFEKSGDISSLVRVLIEGHLWDEAFEIAKRYTEYKRQVYLPYAQWLAETDKFEEAQQAFHNAEMENEAIEVLEKLTQNSVREQRYNDASFYYWKLSMQCLDIARANPLKAEKMVEKFKNFQTKADMYYAYYHIHRFMEEPAAPLIPEAYFNMSRYLVHNMGNIEHLEGISKIIILYTLAKQGKALGSFKMSRYAYEKIQSLKLPERFRKQVQLGALTIRSKPFHDNEDMLPMCYRCSTTNPLLNQFGNVCVNCKEPFIYSFVIFDTLPLVEFYLEDGISDEEAIELINQEALPSAPSQKSGWTERKSQGADTLILDEYNGTEFGSDIFSRRLEMSVSNVDTKVILDRESLRNIPSTEIVVLKWPLPLRYQYFKNVMSDISVVKCEHCLRLFHAEDFELQVLQKGMCPYCRTVLTN